MAKKGVKKVASKKAVSSKKVSLKKGASRNLSVKKGAPKKQNISKPKKIQEQKISPVSKMRAALKGLIFFGILFLISVVCYMAANHELYVQLFFLLSLSFGSIGVALLLTLLIYFFYSKLK